MATKKKSKVTYITLGANLDEFHKEFDKGLKKAEKKIGQTFPHLINNKKIRGAGEVFTSVNPAKRDQVLASFRQATGEEVDAAVMAAVEASAKWAATDYRKRAEIVQKAADLLRKDKFELAAMMSLESGKSRFESMGDIEEAADLMDYYAKQLLDAKGFVKPMGKLAPNEHTKSVLKPFGVWAMVAPFNFPIALPAGMSAGVLLGGNTLVFKPSVDTPWSSGKLAEAYLKAGAPAGVVNLVYGDRKMGQALIDHPKLDGIVFTGSKAVGLKLHRDFSENYIKPVLTELGGKNPAIIMPTADLEAAAEGVMRSAFGLQGQKCSACSRVIVHRRIKNKFMKLLLEKTAEIKIGDPTERDVFMGPLINQKAFKKFASCVKEAQRDGGEILAGGQQLKKGEYKDGYFVEPTIVDGLPRQHRIMREELFLPFLAVCEAGSLKEALEIANDVDYGLTAGIFSGSDKDIDYFFDHIEAGATYANRRSGATTGAWPGVNPFCGWKGSGGSGKGACGPYYVQQFMREQSQTLMK